MFIFISVTIYYIVCSVSLSIFSNLLTLIKTKNQNKAATLDLAISHHTRYIMSSVPSVCDHCLGSSSVI